MRKSTMGYLMVIICLGMFVLAPYAMAADNQVAPVEAVKTVVQGTADAAGTTVEKAANATGTAVAATANATGTVVAGTAATVSAPAKAAENKEAVVAKDTAAKGKKGNNFGPKNHGKKAIKA